MLPNAPVIRSDRIGGSEWFNLVDYYEPTRRWRLHVSLGNIDQIIVANDRNDQPIHGVMHDVKVGNEVYLIGYFSLQRDPTFDAPDYQHSLNIFINNTLLGNDTIQPKFRLTKHAFTRKFEAGQGESWSVNIEYSWPFYHEFMRGFYTDTTYIKSGDFFVELIDVIKSARPEWIINDNVTWHKSI